MTLNPISRTLIRTLVMSSSVWSLTLSCLYLVQPLWFAVMLAVLMLSLRRIDWDASLIGGCNVQAFALGVITYTSIFIAFFSGSSWSQAIVFVAVVILVSIVTHWLMARVASIPPIAAGRPV